MMIKQAVEAIRDAEALLICAGAGIGVDSGLPDFRGNEGFWKAYPPLRDAGISFVQIACPDTFRNDPRLAWGFYGHRLNLYRDTTPHRGFTLLKEWSDGKKHGSFVFTSNVDGQFQKAGFDDKGIAECHGSIHHLQCLYGCSWDIWSAEDEGVAVDEETMTAVTSLPRCPKCLQFARPNVLMFNDWGWLPTRADAQEQQFEYWLTQIVEKKAKIAVIEIGAGRAIPTVRQTGERIADVTGATLIRINPRDSIPPARGKCVSIPLGAGEALQQINALL